MSREATRPTEGRSDRELREALEQAQAEVRKAREALATVEQRTGPARAALASAIDGARAQRDAARSRLEALREEKRALPRELERLRERWSEHQAEQAVLARGAKLRDVYVDWNPADSQQRNVGDGMTVGEVKAWAAVIIGSLVLFILYMAFRR